MNEILRLYFDDKEEDQYLLIQSDCLTIDDLVLTSFVEMHYYGGNAYRITWDEIGHILKFELIGLLKNLLNTSLVLDESIRKELGYLDAQYTNNPERKNLKYIKNKHGEVCWVGDKYNLFDSAYRYKQRTWMYNDKKGNAWIEISPVYPWRYDGLYEGETFVKFSQWLKEFRPYVVRKISREVVQQWVKQLEELLEVVKKNDERLSCTGPDCKLCEQEASQLCKKCCVCQKCENFHNEAVE